MPALWAYEGKLHKSDSFTCYDMLYIFCLKKGNSEVLNVMLGFALKYSIERKNEEEGKKQIKYNGQNVSSARSWMMSILRFIVLFFQLLSMFKILHH